MLIFSLTPISNRLVLKRDLRSPNFVEGVDQELVLSYPDGKTRPFPKELLQNAYNVYGKGRPGLNLALLEAFARKKESGDLRVEFAGDPFIPMPSPQETLFHKHESFFNVDFPEDSDLFDIPQNRCRQAIKQGLFPDVPFKQYPKIWPDRSMKHYQKWTGIKNICRALPREALWTDLGFGSGKAAAWRAAQEGIIDVVGVAMHEHIGQKNLHNVLSIFANLPLNPIPLAVLARRCGLWTDIWGAFTYGPVPYGNLPSPPGNKPISQDELAKWRDDPVRALFVSSCLLGNDSIGGIEVSEPDRLGNPATWDRITRVFHDVSRQDVTIRIVEHEHDEDKKKGPALWIKVEGLGYYEKLKIDGSYPYGAQPFSEVFKYFDTEIGIPERGKMIWPEYELFGPKIYRVDYKRPTVVPTR